MALEKIKNFFGAKVDTEGFNTKQFVSVLQNNVPGSGYERIQKLRNGIAINQNKLTSEDQKLMNDLVDIAVEHTKVADPNLFKQQLETYIRTGEIQEPKSATDPVFHLDETMRTPSDSVDDINESLLNKVLKTEEEKISKVADDFIKKIEQELPQTPDEESQVNRKSVNQIDAEYVERAQKANNPHGFEGLKK